MQLLPAKRQEKYCARKGLCSNILKKNKFKVCISLRVINWNFLPVRFISGAWFGLWFLEKVSFTKCTFLRGACVAPTKHIRTNCALRFSVFSALKLPSYELVILYLQKAGIRKKSWKKYTVALDIKKILNMELNMSW